MNGERIGSAWGVCGNVMKFSPILGRFCIVVHLEIIKLRKNVDNNTDKVIYSHDSECG